MDPVTRSGFTIGSLKDRRLGRLIVSVKAIARPVLLFSKQVRGRPLLRILKTSTRKNATAVFTRRDVHASTIVIYYPTILPAVSKQPTSVALFEPFSQFNEAIRINKVKDTHRIIPEGHGDYKI